MTLTEHFEREIEDVLVAYDLLCETGNRAWVRPSEIADASGLAHSRVTVVLQTLVAMGEFSRFAASPVQVYYAHVGRGANVVDWLSS